MNEQPIELETVHDEQYWVEMYESLDRLHNNEDFQKLILKGYFVDRPVKQTTMLGSKTPVEVKQDIINDLGAVARLREYFAMIANIGSKAKEDIAADEE